MKIFLQKAAAHYGMIGVLLLLCVFFSAVTYSDQSPAGAAGAAQVAAEVGGMGGAPQVLLVSSAQPGDAAFAAALARELPGRGARVVAAVSGEPQAAREALRQLVADGVRLDAIACTQTAGAWLLFADLAADFPELGRPRLVTPRSYRWPNFLKTENLLNIANQIAVIAIMAIGMTLVIVTGGIDLSVGSLLALAAVLVARLIRDYAGGVAATAWGMGLAGMAAVAACGVAGAFSGVMVTRFRIPPFIVTLAMMLVASGMAFILAEGQSIYQLPDGFIWLGRGASLGGVPNAVVLMVVLYGLAHVGMSRMSAGRYLYAVGGNREAARLAGVPLTGVLLGAYTVSGLLAGVGGVIMASQLKSGSATYGNMYELYVIAAVVVGGTSLSGGEGKMSGTLIGAFTIAVIQNGMNLTNVESYTQKVVLGLVILGAVMLDKMRQAR